MQSGKRQDLIDQESLPITVTRHAVQRHLLRSRRRATEHDVVKRLRTAVQDAVDQSALEQVGRSTFLAAVNDGGSDPLWAVLDVSGPSQKPFAIVVCTVLTSAMVTRSFELKHQPPYAA
jgi:hypothetical protein